MHGESWILAKETRLPKRNPDSQGNCGCTSARATVSDEINKVKLRSKHFFKGFSIQVCRLMIIRSATK